MNFYSTLYLILVLFLIQEISANLIGCEGFVNSFIQLDFSKIKIKLYTNQGNLKYDAECNPQNGYFLIPIYNKGKYLVKIIAPDGYVFDVESHEIEINNDNECSKELNFNLIGLKVSGTILNGQDSSLVLGLFEKNGKKLIEKTIADKGGHYSFVTKPGHYVISSISGSTQCLSQGIVEIEVNTMPVNVKPDIRIEGHSLMVNVKDEKGDPLTNSIVILRSDNEINFENLPVSSDRPTIRIESNKWFYEWKTDSSGSTLINCLPPGKYIINAKTIISNDIEANFEEKIVEMNSKITEITIYLKSFNLFGNLFSANGKPLEDVKIKLDGEIKSKSNEQGIFTLINVATGKHILEAEKEYFEFDKLYIDVSSKMDKKIIFFPHRISICGQIVLADKLDQIPFELTSLDNNKFFKHIYTNSEGKFCQLFTPGEYILKPISSMFLSPNKIKIDLSKGPIIDLKFIQHKAKISGTVKCFGKCHKIVLKLFKEDGNILEAILNSNDTFLFTDVLPSNYKLKIFDDQNIWWEENEKELIVQSIDIMDINFLQKGYLLEIKTSKAALLKYWPVINEKSKTEQARKFQLNEGTNQLYFKKENKFSFSIESCYEFKIEGNEENSFNIPSQIPIILTAVISSVSAFIQTDIDDTTLNLKLREKSTNEEQFSQKIYSINKGKMFLFPLNLSKIGNKFEFIPESNKLLFMPKLADFEFTGECEGVAVSFNSQNGKFIQGKVEPKVENAFVKATHKENKNDDLVAFTDDKGFYKIGPVWNIEDFNIEIIKEGFIFVKLPNYPQSFTSIKLTQLRIQFFEEKTNIPLPDILVSISGGLNFRSNNITNESGLLKFIGLTPGSYFILPILQEYKFNSSSFSVQINEGEEKELILEAKRIAYSAFGKVSTIGNRPFKFSIHVEAIAPECENHQEEDLIDQRSGDFRIKGLKSQCNYLISLKDSDGQEIASFPPLIEFIVEKENKMDINFLILPSERPSPIVLGEIDFNNNNSSISTKSSSNGFRIILLENNNIINEQLIKSPATVFFFNLPFYRKEYSINVELIDSKQSNRINLISVNFFANSQFNYVRILPKSENRSSDSEIKANYYGLAFILFLTLAFLNQSKVKLLMEYFLFLIQNFINNRQNGINFNNLISERRRIKK